ncbi:MAG: CarD family transcriptional regulator [Anaerolineae bacterium]|jgi:CarD family transcriptional regulator
MFGTGDAIVHPRRGVGIVTDIREREWQGTNSRYYEIELLGREPNLSLMIPIEEADDLGLRPAIERSEVEEVWLILRSEPQELPSNHKTRHSLLRDKLHAGDIFQVAEVLRDLTWRRQEEGHLTTRGKRIYKEALMFLSGEVAAAQQMDVTEAEMLVREKLRKLSSS